MKGQIKISNTKIIYAIPEYREDRGDVSKIVYEGGREIYMPFHIRTLIPKIAYENYMDITALKRRLQEQLGQRNILPYPFNKDLILIPVKVRTPRVKKDGAFGYINYSWIEEIEKVGKYSMVLFKDKTTLQVLQNYKTLKRRMLQGAWLLECFLPQMQYPIHQNKENALCREELQDIIGQLMDIYKEL